MTWRRLLDVLLRRPHPPTDERSVKAARLARQRDELVRVMDRVDRIVPPSRTDRLRREAMLAEQRFRGG